MADEPENLVLTYLRRIDERLARVEADVHDLKLRMTALESTMARNYGSLAESIALVNTRLDRMDDRLTRLERRMDLAEEAGTPYFAAPPA